MYIYIIIIQLSMAYPLVMTNSLLLKMVIEIVGFTSENAGFPSSQLPPRDHRLIPGTDGKGVFV